MLQLNFGRENGNKFMSAVGAPFPMKGVMMGLITLLTTVLLTAPVSAASLLAYEHQVGEVRRIAVAESDGSNQRFITPANKLTYHPEISADGKMVAYSIGDSFRAMAVEVQYLKKNADGLTLVEQWTPFNDQSVHSEFSGNGKWLAFSGPLGPDGKKAQIGLIDLQAERAKGAARIERSGGVERRIYEPAVVTINDEFPSYFPAVSGDGSFVVYHRTLSLEVKQLVKHTVATGEKTILTAADGFAMVPSLSADDQLVAWAGKRDGVWDLMVMNLVTGEVKQVTHSPEREFTPIFAPDGSLTFTYFPEVGSLDLYRISAESMRTGAYISKPFIADPAVDEYVPSFSGELDMTMAVRADMIGRGRSSFGAVSHNGRVYVAGGHQGSEHTYPPESFVDRLDIYDPQLDQWTEGARLSIARHGFQLAAYGGFIYAFGGFAFSADHKPRWKSVDLIERYDIAADRWEVVGHLPRNRSSNLVGRVGSKIYILGGWDSTPKFDGDRDGKFIREIDVFDLRTEAVSTLPVGIPDPLRRAFNGFVKDGEIYLVGGLGQGASHFELLDTVTIFNPTSMTFRELPKLPFATFAPATGVIGEDMFVFGGMFKTGPEAYIYVNHIYRMNLSEGVWRNTGRYLKEGKGFSQVVGLEVSPKSGYRGVLGILGGHTYEGENDHPVLSFETLGL